MGLNTDVLRRSDLFSLVRGAFALAATQTHCASSATTPSLRQGLHDLWQELGGDSHIQLSLDELDALRVTEIVEAVGMGRKPDATSAPATAAKGGTKQGGGNVTAPARGGRSSRRSAAAAAAPAPAPAPSPAPASAPTTVAASSVATPGSPAVYCPGSAVFELACRSLAEQRFGCVYPGLAVPSFTSVVEPGPVHGGELLNLTYASRVGGEDLGASVRRQLRWLQERGVFHFSHVYGPPHPVMRTLHVPPAVGDDPAVLSTIRTCITSMEEIAARPAEPANAGIRGLKRSRDALAAARAPPSPNTPRQSSGGSGRTVGLTLNLSNGHGKSTATVRLTRGAGGTGRSPSNSPRVKPVDRRAIATAMIAAREAKAAGRPVPAADAQIIAAYQAQATAAASRKRRRLASVDNDNDVDRALARIEKDTVAARSRVVAPTPSDAVLDGSGRGRGGGRGGGGVYAWDEWSAEEDEMLRQAVAKFGTNWEVVRDVMSSQPLRRGRSNHRSSRQCYERYRKVLSQQRSRGDMYTVAMSKRHRALGVGPSVDKVSSAKRVGSAHKMVPPSWTFPPPEVPCWALREEHYPVVWGSVKATSPPVFGLGIGPTRAAASARQDQPPARRWGVDTVAPPAAAPASPKAFVPGDVAAGLRAGDAGKVKAAASAAAAAVLKKKPARKKKGGASSTRGGGGAAASSSSQDRGMEGAPPARVRRHKKVARVFQRFGKAGCGPAAVQGAILAIAPAAPAPAVPKRPTIAAMAAAVAAKGTRPVVPVPTLAQPLGLSKLHGVASSLTNMRSAMAHRPPESNYADVVHKQSVKPAHVSHGMALVQAGHRVGQQAAAPTALVAMRPDPQHKRAHSSMRRPEPFRKYAPYVIQAQQQATRQARALAARQGDTRGMTRQQQAAAMVAKRRQYGKKTPTGALCVCVCVWLWLCVCVLLWLWLWLWPWLLLLTCLAVIPQTAGGNKSPSRRGKGANGKVARPRTASSTSQGGRGRRTPKGDNKKLLAQNQAHLAAMVRGGNMQQAASTAAALAAARARQPVMSQAAAQRQAAAQAMVAAKAAQNMLPPGTSRAAQLSQQRATALATQQRSMGQQPSGQQYTGPQSTPAPPPASAPVSAPPAACTWLPCPRTRCGLLRWRCCR